MGASQRVKGAVFEREVMARFSTTLGKVFKRNISQARDGGHDGIAGPFLIECKRRKTLTTIESWLTQAETALRALSRYADCPTTAVVVCRADQGKAMALLSLDDFLALARAAHSKISDSSAGALPAGLL